MNFKSLLTDSNRKVFAMNRMYHTDRLTHFGENKFEYNSLRKAVIALTMWEPTLSAWNKQDNTKGLIVRNDNKKYELVFGTCESKDESIKARFTLKPKEIVGNRMKLSILIIMGNKTKEPSYFFDMPDSKKVSIPIAAKYHGKVGTLVLNEKMADKILSKSLNGKILEKQANILAEFLLGTLNWEGLV